VQVETSALSLVHHPNIVKMHEFKYNEVYKEKRVACIVLEYVEGGDLFDLMVLGKFPEPICRFYFR